MRPVPMLAPVSCSCGRPLMATEVRAVWVPRGASEVSRETADAKDAVLGSPQAARSPRTRAVLRTQEMELQADLRERLRQWTDAGLRRELRCLDGVGPVVGDATGAPYLNFCSNDYLGLAGDPRLRPPGTVPAGSAASRLVTGHLHHHDRLEETLSEFVARPSALVFSSGYAASVGTLPALVGADDAIFSDRLNHASLIDGARLSRARVHVYPHGDLHALEALLRRERGRGRAIIVSDSLFSMDGDLAPVAGLAHLARRFEAWLYLDEAHALGVLGPQGRGAAAAAQVAPDVLLGTMGKAFGAAGAFIAGVPELREWLVQRARSFVFSTGLSPLVADAARRGVTIAAEEPWRRRRVLEHADRIRTGLRALGFHVPPGEGPIVPVILGDNAEALRLAGRLAERRILAVPIRPPTVPEGSSRIRITPMATHTDAHVDELLAAFREAP